MILLANIPEAVDALAGDPGAALATLIVLSSILELVRNWGGSPLEKDLRSVLGKLSDQVEKLTEMNNSVTKEVLKIHKATLSSPQRSRGGE